MIGVAEDVTNGGALDFVVGDTEGEGDGLCDEVVKYQLQLRLSFVRSTLFKVCDPTPGTVHVIDPVVASVVYNVISIS